MAALVSSQAWTSGNARLDRIFGNAQMRSAIGLLFGGLIVVGGWYSLPFSTERRISQYVFLHNFLELLAVIVCALIFIVSRSSFSGLRNRNLVWLGAGFLGVAILDFLHMNSYAGMPPFITPSGPGKAIAFWLVARILSAVTLLAVSFSNWSVTVPFNHLSRWVFAVLVGITLVSWVILFHPSWIPATFVSPGKLTPFKLGVEVFIIALNAIAVVGFYRQINSSSEATSYHAQYDPIALMAASLTMACAETFFMVYTDVYGALNALGHIYKVLGAWYLYRGIVAANLSDRLIRGDLALSAADFGAWSLDIESDRLECDGRAAEILGCSNSHQQRRDLDALVHQEDLPAKRLALAEAMRPEGDGAYRTEYRTKRMCDGSERRILSLGRTEFRDGRPVRILGVMRDVTELRAIEIERISTRILDALPTSVAVLCRNGEIRSVNRAWRRFAASKGGVNSGLPGVGANFLHFGEHPASGAPQADDHGISAVLNGASPSFSMEYCCGGVHQPRWLLMTAVPFDQDGSGGAIVALVDITQQKLSEQALAASEQRMRLAQEAAHAGTWEWSLGDNQQIWSPSVWSMYGLSQYRDQASFESWATSIHPEDRERVVDVVLSAVKSRREFEVQWRVNGQACGCARWLLSRGQPVVNATGQAERYIGIVMDVSVQKRAQAEAQHQKMLFESVFTCSPDGMVITDNNNQIMDVNPALMKTFGYSVEELRGQSINMLTKHGQDYRFIGTQTSLESRLRELSDVGVRKKGEEFPIEVTAAELRDVSGSLMGRVAVIRDVTDERRREQALREKQRLEALGRLTGGVAHDFNNLLTVISGNLQLVELAVEDDGARKYIAAAVRATEMGARLNQRLMTFARKRRLEPVVTDLGALLTSLAEIVKRSVGSSIDVVLRLTDKPTLVRVDPSEMENAILNLAINAKDAMPDEGRLVFETHVIIDPKDEALAMSDLPPGPHVLLRVTDTGVGMGPEILAHAFEPFFTTKGEGRGTGLGLTTVHGFVRQSDGCVQLKSEPGRGTTVEILLPLVTGQESMVPEVAPSTAMAMATEKGETVLVVEDNADVRAVAAERIRSLGYEVVEADNAGAALAVLRTRSDIDLVFSDVIMPGISGYNLAQQIKQTWPQVKIVLTSGFPDETAHREAPNHSWTLLRKPYSLNDLAKSLANGLAEGRDHAKRTSVEEVS